MTKNLVSVPMEIINAISVLGDNAVVTRFENDRTIHCFVEEGTMVITENYHENDDSACDCECNCECDCECDDKAADDETCCDCPHYCPVCGECTKDKYLR